MKLILRRLNRLEQVAAPDQGGPRWVDVLLDRRRQRLPASGEPEPTAEHLQYPQTGHATWANNVVNVLKPLGDKATDSRPVRMERPHRLLSGRSTNNCSYGNGGAGVTGVPLR
jgi:hypothetical protein